MATMEKENVGNATPQNGSVKGPKPRRSLSSPDLSLSNFLMVSPPPPGLQTPTLTPNRSPPPPNSENITSAIRTVEKLLDLEVHRVNVLASAGPSGKQRGGGAGGGIAEEGHSFESDVSDLLSPEAPIFDMRGFRAGSGRRSLSWSPKRSPKKSPLRSPQRSNPFEVLPRLSPMMGSSMRYSSFGTTPLVNKSLLPLLGTLEEDRTVDESGASVGMASMSIEEGTAGETKDAGEKKEESVDSTAGEEVDFGGADPVDTSGEGGSVTSASHPVAPYRRRIIDDDSSENESDDSIGGENEEMEQMDSSEGKEEIVVDISELNLSDGETEEDDEAPPPPKNAPRQRILESDDDASTSSSSSGSTVSEDGSYDAKQSGDLDVGLSTLTIDDESFGRDADASFGASTTDVDDLISIGDESNEANDDESVTCFDACGCWALDEEHKGDLYLSDNSDALWPKIRLPLALYNKLFPHQRIGIQWMASLHKNEIRGGVLADDMGLGKTMQTLSYLGALMRAQAISNAIVVCPKSVVRSWEREANLILKNLCVEKASVYAVTSDMSKEKRKRIFADAFCCSSNRPRLVVTTYGLVTNHITDLNTLAETFEDHHWNYVVLDEGHLIKNRKTKTSQDVRILSRSKKTRRLLLTGTPIQNNMRELHALFDWAAPTLLGSIQTFMKKYGDPIEDGRQRNADRWTVKKSGEMNAKLKKLLQPYFLQRLKKTEFEDKMPEKKELVVFTALSVKQRRMYERFTESVFDDDSHTPLAAVSWLKMLCGHPSLVKDTAGRYANCDASVLVRDSSKLQVLLALLNRLKRSGHRALVFSQSTKMLDIMERAFDGGLSYLRIDGSSAGGARQKAVDHFNDPLSGIDVMLLSTKAAGIGLTLTGADRAILYDPSWNPAEDAQAVDRCYRIGQTKNVTVYRFIAAGTVEEKMYEKQVHKEGIKRVVLSSDSSAARYFDNAELTDLFKLSPEGECAMMEKFREKATNNATGSSGKPSFLTKHPSVVGVASHDVLYASVAVDVDLTSPKSGSSGETPFSRSPFQKSGEAAKKPSGGVRVEDLTNQVEDLTIDAPLDGRALMPLGGLNKTRQKREDAKAKREQEKAEALSDSTFSIDAVLIEVDGLIADEMYGKAMEVLLDVVETKMDTLGGEEKLAVHKKVSHTAGQLGRVSINVDELPRSVKGVSFLQHSRTHLEKIFIHNNTRPG
ncbi:hypothetical protein ACHAXT_004876 [Thalassiosira profunda]